MWSALNPYKLMLFDNLMALHIAVTDLILVSFPGPCFINIFEISFNSTLFLSRNLKIIKPRLSKFFLL